MQLCFRPMPQYALNCSSLWNMHEQDLSQSLSEHLTPKVTSQSQHNLEMKHLGSSPHDQDSSSSQSLNQSQQDSISMEKPNSQDQGASSTTDQDEGYQKHIEGQLEPAYLVGSSDFWTNPSQLEMIQASIHIPNFSGMFTAYGPHPMVQQHMVGTAPGRVPLPADLTEDGPIYVNAKQYHGILRRRQIRAKLEAQNKLIKTRKPYLHESRHVHAINRVRGSGGRFLSTKKSHQTESTPSPSSNTLHFHKKGNMLEADEQHMQARTHYGRSFTRYDVMQNTKGEFKFKQPDPRFSSMCTTEQRGAPVVR